MQAGNASLSDSQSIRIQSQLPSTFVWAVVAICVVPFLLNLGGIDFGSSVRPFPYAEAAGSVSNVPVDSESTGDNIDAELPGEFLDPMFYRLSGAFTHTILEWSAFCTAIFAVLLAFATFRVTRSVVIPVIAVALFFAGVMDAFHTLAADRLIEAVTPNRDLIPFTWAICRFFKALIPILGIVIVIVRPTRLPRTDIAILMITSVGFLCLAYVIIHLCATSDRLPQTMFPQALFTRPWDLIPLVVYVLSGLFVYPRFHRAHPSIFSHALLVSVIPDSATQVYMAFGSTELFDNHFNIAHFLKIFAYFVPVAGLVLDYVRTHEVQGRILEALRSSEERTRAIVDHVVDGIITIDERGHVAHMNPAAERIFGYRSDELLGKTVGRLMPEAYWSEYQAQIQGFLATGEAELIGVGREVEGLHKNGTVLPMELTVSAGIIDDRSVFTGVIRDTTERRHLEEERRGRELEARLVHQAASMAADTDSFEGALQHCVDTVCELTGWPVGHVYFPADGEPDLLKPSTIWHLDRSQEFTRFVDATEQTDFRRGVGLPGRILASGSPAWIENVHTDPDFPRAGLFEEVEVKGAFGFPIHVAGEIVAVLKFFSPKEVKEDARLLHIVASVGAQVGRVLEPLAPGQEQTP